MPAFLYHIHAGWMRLFSMLCLTAVSYIGTSAAPLMRAEHSSSSLSPHDEHFRRKRHSKRAVEAMISSAGRVDPGAIQVSDEPATIFRGHESKAASLAVTSSRNRPVERCLTDLTVHNWHGSAKFSSDAEIAKGDSIESKMSFARPLAVEAEMSAVGRSDAVAMMLFGSGNSSQAGNAGYSIETGVKGSHLRMFPGAKQVEAGPNMAWNTVKIDINANGNVFFYLDGALKYTAVDANASVESGTITFVALNTTMKVRNVKILSGGGCNSKAACFIANSNKQDGDGCACLTGYAGTITTTGTVATGTCSPVPCKPPHEIMHSRGCREGSKISVGASCTAHCADGYSPDVPSLKCKLGGLYLPETFECVKSQCPAPVDIPDAAVVVCEEGNIINASEACSARCRNGFSPSAPRLVCAMGGSLTPTTFSCTKAACNVPNSTNVPGLECACRGGYVGKIKWSGMNATGNCVPAACNIDNSEGFGDGCTCKDGFSGLITWSGPTALGSCVPAVCMVKDSNSQVGTDCACKDGFSGAITWKGSVAGGLCSPAPCSIANSAKAPGTQCACSDGYIGTIAWSGPNATGECTPVPCSIQHSNKAPGPACSCDKGYTGAIVWAGDSASGSCLAADCGIPNSNKKPGLACSCGNGYTGKITWAGSTASGSCKEAACTIVHSNQEPGPSCACKDGYTGNITWSGETAHGSCTLKLAKKKHKKKIKEEWELKAGGLGRYIVPIGGGCVFLALLGGGVYAYSQSQAKDKDIDSQPIPPADAPLESESLVQEGTLEQDGAADAAEAVEAGDVQADAGGEPGGEEVGEGSY